MLEALAGWMGSERRALATAALVALWLALARWLTVRRRDRLALRDAIDRLDTIEAKANRAFGLAQKSRTELLSLWQDQRSDAAYMHGTLVRRIDELEGRLEIAERRRILSEE